MAYAFEYVERVFPGSLPEAARGFRLSPARAAIFRSLRTPDPTLPHRPVGGGLLRHAVSMALLDRWVDAARYIVVHSASRTARALGISRIGAPGRA